MKEPFVSLNQLITDTTLLSDQELQAYLGGLDSAGVTQFVSTQVNGAVSETMGAKSGAFVDNFNRLQTSDKVVYSQSKYYINSMNLKGATQKLDEEAQASITANAGGDQQNVRQYEINEWANANKLETLYVLQLILVFVSFACVLLFLNINGVVNSSLFKLLTGITGVIILIIILVRGRYTAAVRDGRYWDKSRFPRQVGTNGQPPPVAAAGCPAS